MTTCVQLELTVNDTPRHLEIEPRESLADVLRERLGLTGTHLGCEHGVCGACSVLLNGHTVRSCITFAVQARAHHVTTIEGLANTTDGQLHPLQKAFRDCHALQCGFCTPGFVMASYELLRQRSGVTPHTIRKELSGNLCRCTGYHTIIDAVMQADQRWTRPSTDTTEEHN